MYPKYLILVGYICIVNRSYKIFCFISYHDWRILDMGFLNKLLTGKQQEKAIIPSKMNIVEYADMLKVHTDIQDLLWFSDGPRKNYLASKNQHIYEYEGFRISVSWGADTEPSIISSKLPISLIGDYSSVERPPYFPSYSELTPEQRGVYWKLLEDPYNSNFEIGYVFILYYGLERHLLEGDFEKAFSVILKLRDTHNNGSFQSYSASALILTSLFRQRADLAISFFKSLDKGHELNFSNDLYLFCKFALHIPLTCKDMIRMAKTFEFNNYNYIKKYPDLFEDNLRKCAVDRFNSDMIDMKSFVSASEWKKLKKQAIPMFANISIPNRSIEIPLLSDSFKLKREVYTLLETAHEETKNQLVIMRKTGIMPEEALPKVGTKIIKPIEFDTDEEQRLLMDIKKYNKRILDKHFTFIAIQEFYYKYRELSSEYLQKCIDYCIEDIMMLSDIQKCHYTEEKDRILKLSSIYGKKETDERIKAIEPFKGGIPAFYRLAVIYEKQADYAQALKICDQAIEYYNGINASSNSLEFIKRREKLETKMNRKVSL